MAARARQAVCNRASSMPRLAGSNGCCLPLCLSTPRRKQNRGHASTHFQAKLLTRRSHSGRKQNPHQSLQRPVGHLEPSSKGISLSFHRAWPGASNLAHLEHRQEAAALGHSARARTRHQQAARFDEAHCRRVEPLVLACRAREGLPAGCQLWGVQDHNVPGLMVITHDWLCVT